MATSPPSRPTPLPPQAERAPPPDRSTGATIRREAIFLAIAALLGFVVVPLLIWVTGNRILGTYTHTQDPTAGTGPARLLADYFYGLTHGSLAFWCVAIGPYVLIWCARLVYGFWRSPGAASASRG